MKNCIEVGHDAVMHREKISNQVIVSLNQKQKFVIIVVLNCARKR